MHSKILFTTLCAVCLVIISADVEVFTPSLLNIKDAVRSPDSIPSFECWETLKHEGWSCASLTDDLKYRFALALTNCFLAKQGLTTYPCDKDTPFPRCTRPMEPVDRQILGTFYAYTDNYCLRADVHRFQHMTAATIDSLYRAAEDAGTELGSIKQYSETIHSRLGLGLQRLSELDAHHRAARETLDHLQTAAADASARTAAQLDALTQTSSGISVSMQATQQSTAKLAASQEELAAKQAQLAASSAETLKTLHAAAGTLSSQIDAALSQQAALFAGQQDALAAIGALDSAQQAVRKRIEDGLVQQGVLLDGQRELLAEQARSHSEAMDRLSAVGSQATHIQNDLRDSLALERELALAQVQARLQLEAMVSDHQRSLQGLADQSTAVRTAVEFVLDHIASLRSLVVSQFFDIKSIFFYIAVFIATLVATATTRTAPARLPVLVVFGALVFGERFIVRSANNDAEAAAQLAWLARKVAIAVAGAIIAAVAVRHRDYMRMAVRMMQRSLDDGSLLRSELERCRVEVSGLRGEVERIAASQEALQRLLEQQQPAEAEAEAVVAPMKITRSKAYSSTGPST